MKNWLLAARPKTLTAAVVPVLLGAALAGKEAQNFSANMVVLILLSSMCIQIATNLINDAVDFHKGADTSERIGPMRMTQSGRLTSKQVMLAGGLFLLLALCFGIPVVLQAGWPIMLVGVVSLLLAYGYTGGPFPLAYLGLGDLFVFVFFGLIAVSGTYFVSSGIVTTNAFVAGAQIGFLATVLIAINNLRDVNGDRLAGKKTLAVRFGMRFVRYEIALLIGFSFFLSIYWIFQGKLWPALLPFLTLPLGVKIARQIYQTDPSPIYNQFLVQSAALHAGFGLLLSLGFVLS